jgi:magnesium-transporting ATPase (P-type)
MQAERATEALREFLPAQAKVRRDGAERDIDVRELVPGDVILLSAPGDATDTGSPLHNAYLTSTTMTFAGITFCQVGTAFASRTTHSSLRAIGVFSNRFLLWGIVFELVFAAAVVYLPPLQQIFGTAPLGVSEIAVLSVFPIIVWGSDELRRWWRR